MRLAAVSGIVVTAALVLSAAPAEQRPDNATDARTMTWTAIPAGVCHAERR